MIYKESPENALNVIAGWGTCELCENNIVLRFLISTQKLYFGDIDAIYDVIFLEPVRK